MTGPAYALVTSAKDEAPYIGETVRSVLAQTVRPCAWVIVDDGSRDGTAEVVKGLLHPSVDVRLEVRPPGPRDFTSKVAALNRGYELLREVPFTHLGILDADITPDPDYYERMLGIFSTRPRLGIAGGVLMDVGPDGRKRRNKRAWSVSGGVQLFRRECFEEIGMFHPMRYGEEDTVAEFMALWRGWEVESFEGPTALHHKPSSGGRFPASHLLEGRRDYSYGTHPLYELLRCANKSLTPPLLAGALLRLAGFLACHLRREPRNLPPGFLRFVRQAQLARISPFRRLKGWRLTHPAPDAGIPRRPE